MSFWKKLGGILVAIPLFVALVITITNIGQDNSGFWVLGVILLVMVSCVLSIPAGLFVWIGVRRDRKKRDKQADKDDYKFDSFIS